MKKDKKSPGGDEPRENIPAEGAVCGQEDPLTEEAPPAADEIRELTEEIARVRADFYNYKARVERDRERDRKMAAERAVTELLPVLENLERICDSTGDKEGPLYKGMTMVVSQFSSVLCGMGLEQICAEGEFDPGLHEAVTTEPVDDEAKDGFIIGTLRKGYKLAGRVIRAAQVRVGKFVK